MRHSIRRLAAGAAGAAIAGLSAMTPAVAATVVPDGVEQLVRVELHTLEPAAAAPGDRVEITGSITNVTSEPLRNVQALLRYDGAPLTDRSDIIGVTTGADLHWGWRPGHIYDIVRDELAPDESARFDLEFTVETDCHEAAPGAMPCLGLPAAGVHAIGVDVNATTAGGDRHTGGTARTVMPWQISAADPVRVALLWPVLDTPAIGSLLAAPGDAPVTWAVDPDIWAPEVAEAVDGAGELIVLPPSAPDTGALSRVDRGLAERVTDEVVRRQREFTPTGVQAWTDAAWPGAGAVTEPALQAWAGAGVERVVLPRDAVVMLESSPTASLRVGGRNVSALLTDPGLDAAIADNAHPDETSVRSAVLDLRQRWLADTALARAEPFRPGAAALVAAPPAGWRPPPEVVEAVLDVWTTTDWIEPAAVSSLTEAAAPQREAAPVAVPAPTLDATAGLPDDYMRDVKLLHDDLARYRSLLGGSDETSRPSPSPSASADSIDASADGAGPPSPAAVAEPSLAAARAASVAWQHDLDAARAEVSALRQEVAEALAGVSVVVNPSNTLSGNTGVFPVNISNELAHAVTVRLEFDPANEDRLAIEPIEARVPGGRQQTVQVRASAVANGEVPVTVQLATVDGVPLGGAKHTIVNATDYGRIGWLIVAGSALLFAGGLTWRMLRGRRRTRP